MKRIFSFLFVAVLAGQACAATTFTIGNLKYTVTDETNHYVSVGKGSTLPSGAIDLQPKVTNTNDGVEYTVTSIGSDAFAYCSGLTSVTIPNSVTSIGSNAFRGCSGLTEINVENGNTAYASENGVLFNKDKTNLICYPASKTETTYTIPNSVTSIGNYAFHGCSELTSISIPNSITSIGDRVFVSCDNLLYNEYKGVLYLGNAENPYLCLISPKFTKKTTYEINNDCRIINSYAFEYCYCLSTINIPNSVISIGNLAFCACSDLVSVSIPNSVKSIGIKAFSYCDKLATISIPTSVTSIGDHAFEEIIYVDYSGSASGRPWGAYYVNGIVDDGFVFADAEKTQLVAYIGNEQNITIPNSIQRIQPFRCSSDIETIIIPNSVTKIDEGAFSSCLSLKSIIIPNSVTEIGEGAFRGCISLESITLPFTGPTPTSNLPFGFIFGRQYYTESVKTEQIYYSDKKYTCYIPKSLREVIITQTNRIKTGAFYGCEYLSSITLPNSVRQIDMAAFYGCKNLYSINIPNSVKTIGESAFYGCTALKTTSIPNSVTGIGTNAFYDVETIIYTGSAAGNPWGAKNVGIVTDEDGFVYADAEKTQLVAYIGDKRIITIPNSVTSIGSHVFDGCNYNISVTVPNDITDISSNAFINIKNIIYTGSEAGNPWGAATVGVVVDEDGFVYSDYEKTHLVAYVGNAPSITIPITVTHIDEKTFSNCKELTSITISNDDYIIRYRNNKPIYLDGVYNIFSGCNNLMELNVTGNTTYTSENGVLFKNNKLICYPAGKTETTYSIPQGTTSVCSEAFNNCSKLSTIIVPNSIRLIDVVAFSNCKSLRQITLPNTITDILAGAFQNCTNLTSICIPNSVTFIDQGAFRNCENLRLATIPKSVYVGFEAFSNCDKVIIYLERGASLGSHSFEYYPTNDVINNCIVVSVNTDNNEYGSVEIVGENYELIDDYGSLWYLDDAANKKITITATPATGYHCRWNDGNTNNTLTEDVTESKTYTATFEAHTETYRFENINPATCTVAGSQDSVVYCSVCNKELYRETLVIPALGHSYGAPTYAWVEDGSACTATTVCQHDNNHVITENATITSEVTTAATCEGMGTTTYTANFTDNNFSTQTKNVVDIPALQHSYGTPTYAWAEDGSACTATTLCLHDANHVITENANITSEVTTAATCEGMGTTTYTAAFTDSKFSTQTKNVVDISALQHSYGAPTYVWAEDGSACTATTVCQHDANHVITENANITSEVTTAATCEGMGTTTYTAAFTDSKFATQTKNVVDIPALQHSYGTPTYAWAEDGSACTATTVCQHDANHVVTENATITSEETIAPTCEEMGTTTYTANFTDSKFTTQTKAVMDILANGHTDGVAVFENVVAPTCTASGSRDSVVYCTVCQAEVSRTKKEIAKLAHTEVTDAAKAPTCTETGLTEGKHCSVCNMVLVAQQNVEALGHSEVTDAAKAPTCTETGLTEGKHCSVCNAVLIARENIDALGHKEVTDAAVAATCTESGLTEGKHCSVCNTVLVKQETVPALGHKEAVDAAVAATCTEAGKTEGKHCSVCNTVLVAQQEVAALGHKEVVDAAVAATCTEAGKTEGKHCSVCNTVLVAQQEVAALGHKEVVDTAVAATCTEAGLTEGKHCSVCSTVIVKQDTVPAKGHTIVIDPLVEPTCTETGLGEGKHCAVCDEFLWTQELLPPLGHEFKTYVFNNDATTEADGTETALCEHGCGAKDTRTAEGTKIVKTPEDGGVAIGDEAANTLNIYAHHNIIVVENAADEIRVYDATGRLICKDIAHNAFTEFRMNTTGIFIVKTGNTTKRVAIMD